MNNLWHREGLYYVSRSVWTSKVPGPPWAYNMTVTRKYFFVTYHLIRWLHGDKELERMAKLEPQYPLLWHK